MRTYKFYNMLGVLAAAAAIFSTASCDKEPGKDETPKAYTLELANPLDAEIFVNNGNTDEITVALTLENLSKDQLSVTATSNPDSWCAARLNEAGDAVIITPGENKTENDLVATFGIGASVEGVEPVTIKVTSTGSGTEIYVEFESGQLTEGEYGTFTFKPSAAGEELTVTIRTNAEKWYLNDMNMVTDDDFNPVEWYTADKKSGRNGETCTITFSPNDGSDDRMTSLMFVDTPDGYGTSITVTQPGKPATSVTVTYYDESYNEITAEGNTLDVTFAKDASTWDTFDFELEKDGSVDFLFVKPGTTEADTEIEGADDPWIGISATYGYSIVPSANNSGAARSTDLIIRPAGSTTELFRFKITQAGE